MGSSFNEEEKWILSKRWREFNQVIYPIQCMLGINKYVTETTTVCVLVCFPSNFVLNLTNFPVEYFFTIPSKLTNCWFIKTLQVLLLLLLPTVYLLVHQYLVDFTHCGYFLIFIPHYAYAMLRCIKCFANSYESLSLLICSFNEKLLKLLDACGVKRGAQAGDESHIWWQLIFNSVANLMRPTLLQHSTLPLLPLIPLSSPFCCHFCRT